MSKQSRRTVIKAALSVAAGWAYGTSDYAPKALGGPPTASEGIPMTKVLILDAKAPHAVLPIGPLHLGTSRAPNGHTLYVDSQSLLKDGRPWLPVMGEFHYSRFPEEEWHNALLQMKAGGIDVVSTYVFWIHHEEVENQFDWSGQRSLRTFVETCQAVGLPVIVRCGPWCHGEVRNGGLPDWTLAKGYKTRSLDTTFLSDVRRLYTEIASQLTNLLWKEGGPVIGLQVDNEYHGPAEYLLALKTMARELGLDTPIYTRTGWPKLTTPMPAGEMLPLAGGYPDGFWDRVLTPMPGGYADGYRFLLARAATSAAIGTDILGAPARREGEETGNYPYFCCELGGGMETSYHRRIQISPQDIESLGLVKVGSGNNLQGYYMYHGGTNPDGKLSTLEESQATKYANDMPIKSYDFQAPIGEFGQLRPHYHGLRRLHLFLQDWGELLARMPAHVPEINPSSAHDTDTLRWSARTDGHSGFVFVNNYQRLQPMPAKAGVQLSVVLPDGEMKLPAAPMTVPADSAFFWPVNMEMAGAKLTYATAQPICQLMNGKILTVVFAQTPGVMTEFVFDTGIVIAEHMSGTITHHGANIHITNVTPSPQAAVTLRTGTGHSVQIILLSDTQSRQCWKGKLAGQERLFLTAAGLTIDGDILTLTASGTADLSVSILPAVKTLKVNGKQIKAATDGEFHRYDLPSAHQPPAQMTLTPVRDAGPVREVAIGRAKVAEAPGEDDWKSAAAWQVSLPKGAAQTRDLLLRVRYAGDAARFTLDGKLLTDNFFNGNVFDLGVKRYAPEIDRGKLLLEILPMRKDAPIYLSDAAKAMLTGSETTLALHGIDVIEQSHILCVCV